MGVLLFLLTACNLTHAQNSRGSTTLRLNHFLVEDGVRFDVYNTSTKDASVEFPIIISPGEELSGIEFLVRSYDGVRYNLCANIHPLGAPRAKTLEPDQKLEFSVRFDYISQIYCLDAGRYTLNAIYHHVVDGEIAGPDLVSKDVHFSADN